MSEDGVASVPGVDRDGDVTVYRGLLRNRSFIKLMLSTLTSTVGDWIGFLAIIALTSEIMGVTRAAAFAVSGVMIARVLPSLVMGPVAGVFVDRWNRKRVMVVTHLGRGLVMALIPFTNEVFTLVLATLVIEAMSTMFAPAKDAVLPSLVRGRELVAANQVNLLSTYGTLPLAAVLYSLLLVAAEAFAPEGSFIAERTLAVPIWFNAVTFWFAAPLIATLPISRVRRPAHLGAQEGAWSQLKEGFRFVGTQPVIRGFIVGVMVAAAAAGVVITAGEFFARLLNAGDPGYGILVAIVGAGLVAGLVLAEPITRRIRPERLFAPAIATSGAALAVTATMPNLLATVPSALLMGGGAGVVFIVGYTVLQQRADDRIRGRIFGAFNSGVRLAIFGSAVAVPAVIGIVGREPSRPGVLDDGSVGQVYAYTFGGVRWTLIAAGLLAVAGAAVVGWSLARALDREEGQPAPLSLVRDRTPPELDGVFVSFEGGDGAGKSTQIRLLRSALERTGRSVVVTREPGGTRVGEEIRQLLLRRAAEEPTSRTEALLYAAARAQHVEEVIRPALRRGSVVLCDRFVDSSIAYQGAGRGLGEASVDELNRWATDALRPQLVVLLDVDPGAGLDRAAQDGDADRLESAGIAFHRRTREAFLRRAEVEPERYLLLDARRPVEELHAEIRDRLTELLPPLADRGAPAADASTADGEPDGDGGTDGDLDVGIDVRSAEAPGPGDGAGVGPSTAPVSEDPALGEHRP